MEEMTLNWYLTDERAKQIVGRNFQKEGTVSEGVKAGRHLYNLEPKRRPGRAV